MINLKLDKEICKIDLICNVEVYHYDNEKGQGKYANNSWTHSKQSTVTQQELDNWIFLKLLKDFNSENLIVRNEDLLKPENLRVRDDWRILISQIVDKDNRKPAKDQKNNLFLQDISIRIEINGQKLKSSVVEDLLGIAKD